MTNSLIPINSYYDLHIPATPTFSLNYATNYFSNSINKLETSMDHYILLYLIITVKSY